MTPKPDDLEPHLRYVTTARGMIQMPELHTHAHGSLHLSESASDQGAFVWLRASAANSLEHPLSDRTEVVLHVSLDDLDRFMEQLDFLLDHHRKSGMQGRKALS